MEHITFPAIGYGTNELEKDTAVELVQAAIESGYRLIDTAPVYGTEKSVGGGIRRSILSGAVTREELIIQTKLSNSDQGYYSTLQAFDRSLNELGQEYIDVYLIHWPIPKDHEKDYKDLNIASWQAMEELAEKSRIRMIGVCNFLPRHLLNIMEICRIMPAVDQIELHPAYQQKETVDFCHEHGIQLESWGPFRKGAVFSERALADMAEKKGVSVAELVYAWNKNIHSIPLIKAGSLEHMKSNLLMAKETCELTEEDMSYIGRLDSLDGHMDFWNYKRQLKY